MRRLQTLPWLIVVSLALAILANRQAGSVAVPAVPPQAPPAAEQRNGVPAEDFPAAPAGEAPVEQGGGDIPAAPPAQ